jgi:hypothetical protein
MQHMDTCYERSEKYRFEALKPVTEFRKYKMSDWAATKSFILPA